jgi:hypothetical protein
MFLYKCGKGTEKKSKNHLVALTCNLCTLALRLYLLEDSDTSGNLLAVVEDTEEVDSTGVVGGFCHTEEESNQQKTDKVVADGSQTRYDGP